MIVFFHFFLTELRIATAQFLWNLMEIISSCMVSASFSCSTPCSVLSLSVLAIMMQQPMDVSSLLRQMQMNMMMPSLVPIGMPTTMPSVMQGSAQSSAGPGLPVPIQPQSVVPHFEFECSRALSIALPDDPYYSTLDPHS